MKELKSWMNDVALERDLEKALMKGIRRKEEWGMPTKGLIEPVFASKEWGQS